MVVKVELFTLWLLCREAETGPPPAMVYFNRIETGQQGRRVA